MIRRSLFAIVFAASVVTTAAQQLPPPSGQSFERPVVTIGAGPQKLRVDEPLVIGGQRFRVVSDAGIAQGVGGLADLRLFDGTGRELPYLLIAPPSRRPQWIAGELLPVLPTKKTSGFEVDLGEMRPVDALQVDGLPAPFLKRLVLEGSGDRAHWTMLAREGTLFDLPQERVRQTSIDFVPGTYRYLRLMWDDTNSGVLPTPRRVTAREAVALTPSVPLRTPVTIDRQTSEPGRSRYRVRLPGAGLPIVAVVLDAGTGDVFRTATVMESRFNGVRADPVELGRSRLVRMAQDAAPPSALRLPIDPPRGSELQLVIEDGSNSPLELTRVAVEFAELPWIYFEAPAGSVTARYGTAIATPPQYDLEAKRAAVRLETVGEASWGTPRPTSDVPAAAPAPSLPDRGARLDSAGFTYRRALPEGAAGLVALQLDAPVLAHSLGPNLAFSDVRIVDSAGNQIPYLIERRDEPLSIDLAIHPSPGDLPTLRDRGAANRSIYVVTLPYANLTGQRLVIETSDRVFKRPVEVGVERPSDRQHRDAWFDTLATRVWQHADQGTPAPPLDLTLRPGDATRLLLIVDEGDNRALPITAARLLLPSWRLRFFRPSEPLQLIYGREGTRAPEYDLALLAPAVMGADADAVTAAPETAPAATPATMVSRRMFWIGIVAAVVVLLVLIVRLISSGTAPPPSQPAP